MTTSYIALFWICCTEVRRCTHSEEIHVGNFILGSLNIFSLPLSAPPTGATRATFAKVKLHRREIY